MSSPLITALQPTYRKADSDIWVLNIEDIPVPTEPVNDRQLVHLSPGNIGGNHSHPRTEWFVAIGKNITFYWLDEAGWLCHEQMAPEGEILLFEVPPFLPHAIKNESEQSGMLMEFGSDKMKDVERVMVIPFAYIPDRTLPNLMRYGKIQLCLIHLRKQNTFVNLFSTCRS